MIVFIWPRMMAWLVLILGYFWYQGHLYYVEVEKINGIELAKYEVDYEKKSFVSLLTLVIAGCVLLWI